MCVVQTEMGCSLSKVDSIHSKSQWYRKILWTCYIHGDCKLADNLKDPPPITDLYMDTNEFKKGYNRTTDIVWGDTGDLIADSHTILARWRNHFSQLLNIHEVNGYWNAAKTQITSVDQIPAELIQAEYRRVCSTIHKLQITSIWNKKELPK